MSYHSYKTNNLWDELVRENSREVPAARSTEQHFGMLICMVLGMLVLVLLARLFYKPIGCQQRRMVPMMISSFKAAVAQTTGASAQAGDQDDQFCPKEMMDAGKCVNLSECKKGDPGCAVDKEVSEEKQAEYAANLRKFISENQTCVVMVYAPWCGHCTTAKPKFIEASNETDVKFGMVNGDLLPRSMIMGPNSLLQVSHYPFFAKFEKGTQGEHNVTVYQGPFAPKALKEFAENSALQQLFA